MIAKPARSTPEGSALGDKVRRIAARFPWMTLARWFIVGIAFLAVGTALLWAAKELLHLPLLAATIVSAELTLLIRFFINDAWVFKNQRPSWRRLWQFHVAGAGGFAVWLAVTNTLPLIGIHYLIASAAGSAVSMLFSILTNFLWIWRKRDSHTPPAAAEATAPTSN
jgi:putative flippase GtrA